MSPVDFPGTSAHRRRAEISVVFELRSNENHPSGGGKRLFTPHVDGENDPMRLVFLGRSALQDLSLSTLA
jgi:hypothetical protein